MIHGELMVQLAAFQSCSDASRISSTATSMRNCFRRCAMRFCKR